uniref:Ig-like domain-containing protein n=1 Tax=Callorhinchus milii TaxID=7868 RepID=A0A4W3GVX9_CALMI
LTQSLQLHYNNNNLVIQFTTVLWDTKHTVTTLCRISCETLQNAIRPYIKLKDYYYINVQKLKWIADNKTLTLVGVLRSDSGKYTCHVYNAVSGNTSHPFLLNVNYGPGLPIMSTVPDQTVHGLGTTFDLLCSVDSNPTSQFKWFHNGASLLLNSQQITISNISTNHTGNYTCQRFIGYTVKSSDCILRTATSHKQLRIA